MDPLETATIFPSCSSSSSLDLPTVATFHVCRSTWGRRQKYKEEKISNFDRREQQKTTKLRGSTYVQYSRTRIVGTGQEMEQFGNHPSFSWNQVDCVQ